MAISAGVQEFSVDFMNRMLMLSCQYKDQPPHALAEFTKSDPADLRIVSWTTREIRALESAVRDDAQLNLRELKKAIPNKHFGDIVRAYYQYKG